MNRGSTRYLMMALVFTALLPLAACGLSVTEAEEGKKKVDIRTPIGDLSVRTNVEGADTGLPVYPGARPLRDEDETKSANVSIGTPLFGVNVVAAKFESNDTPQAITDFYKKAMKAYGDVTECRGEIDFKGRAGRQNPVCKEKATAREIQLVAGTEERHRIVSVKPRGSGAEFAVVYIQTRPS